MTAHRSLVHKLSTHPLEFELEFELELELVLELKLEEKSKQFNQY